MRGTIRECLAQMISVKCTNVFIVLGMLMALLLLLIFCGIPSFSGSIPSPLPKSEDTSHFNRNATRHQSGWVNEPNVRGTFGIVWACLATLISCAWSAYHPSVPLKNSKAQRVLYRLQWLGIAICAPEYVLYCAWRQNRAAHSLRNQLVSLEDSRSNEKELVKKTPECSICKHDQAAQNQETPTITGPSHAITWPCSGTTYDTRSGLNDKLKERRPLWSLSVAFFAISGGFCVDSSSFHFKSKLVFTPAGLIELAKAGLLPSVEKAEIEDKSKHDVFAKTVVILQVSWFLIQTIARLKQNLPISLLELHTLTQVACAILMYVLWFKKPYDIGNPIELRDPRIVQMAALFSLSATNQAVWVTMALPKERCMKKHWPELEHVQNTHLLGQQALSPWQWFQRMIYPYHFLDYLFKETHVDDEKCKTHLHLACQAIDRLKSRNLHFSWAELVPEFDDRGQEYFRKLFVFFEVDYVATKVSESLSENVIAGSMLHTWKSNEYQLANLKRQWLRHAGFTLLSAAHGGIHLGAWNYPFPSTIEKWFWRASGLAFTGIPFLYLSSGTLRLCNALVQILEGGAYEVAGSPYDPDSLADSSSDPQTPRALTFLRCISSVLIWMVVVEISFPFYTIYLPARIYLFIESFVSLRQPPDGTYMTVKWTSFLPHGG